jgi:hypothetical protein
MAAGCGGGYAETATRPPVGRIAPEIKQRALQLSGLAHLGDFYHKMRKAARHCEAAQPTKQSMHITLLSASGWLPAAFRAVAMTIISADHHSTCLSLGAQQMRKLCF